MIIAIPNNWKGKKLILSQITLVKIAITGSIVPKNAVSFALKYFKLLIKNKNATAVPAIIPKDKYKTVDKLILEISNFQMGVLKFIIMPEIVIDHPTTKIEE